MYQNVRVRSLLLVWTAASIVTFTACGGGAATATQLLPSPSATAPNDPRGLNCGTIETRGPETVNGPGAQQSEDCIWQAYQQCATVGRAFLTIQEPASPAREISTTRNITVQGSGGGCTIEEMVNQQVFAPVIATRAGTANTPTATPNTCAGLTRDPNGTLHFQACGKDGEIVVAPPKR